MKSGTSIALGLVMSVSVAVAGGVWTVGNEAHGQGALVAPGLVVPHMNPMNGKKLFASRGCVVCHQVHGIGGTDAPSLDIKTINPDEPVRLFREDVARRSSDDRYAEQR